MKKQLLIIVFLFALVNQRVYSQATCAAAAPFCTSTGVTFPASTSTTAPTGPNYGCLGSQPNPAWYYLNISTAGNIDITLTNSAGVDIDFIAWGPFASQAAMCTGIFGSPATSGFDCSYSTAATEYVNIVGATVGQWYMVLITNFSGMPTNISATQSGGSGATNCNILCNMTGLTAVPGACNPATNQFNLTGTITTAYPPPTGTLTITNSCGGSQVLNPPFATSINYSFPNLPANGAACSITATYSADPTCTLTQNYSSPAPCAVTCNISAITATPTACNTATQQYDVSGNVTFTNAPASGTLTITNSCGGAPVVLNAPFVSPAAYSFTGLSANGAACNITATFSATPACTFTQNYTAPAPCPLACSISGVTATPTACNSATQQYDVSGNVTFVNAPASGTLTITNSCGGAPIVLNAPFVSPAAYSFTGLSANGAACNVTATFSATPACTFTQNYAAPAPCPLPCAISGLTANPSACDPITNNYSLTGSISFANPPATGTLTVSSSCGGTPQVFNAPFVSPMAYALNGITSNGAACTVTAVFSADATCTFTQNYTAPASCIPCPVTAGNNGPICAGQTLNLTATNVAGATYSWTGPGGFVSALQNPSIPGATAAMSGTYTVTITVNVPAFCTSNSTTNVTVNPLPNVIVNSPTTCAGVGVTLTAGGATSYSWAPGGQTTNAISVPGTAGTYTITGTTNGCSSTAIATVTTSPPPTANFVANVTSGCNPLLVTFTADTLGNAGASYNWSYGDGTVGTNVGYNPTHFYNTDGCQTVVLTVSYGAGCTATDSVPCYISVYPQPDANFFMSSNEVDVLNPTISFMDASSHSNIWFWNFHDGATSPQQNPVHTFPDSGTYPVTLYASNSNGCIDSVTYNVIINEITTIYIPNSFSPNGDGVNDVFNIHGYGISAENFELMIFDRWGNRIFLTRDLNEGWKGSVNNTGEVVQEDVYVYKVNYRDLNNRKKKIIGHVTIVK
jgi:gliding motility-associated-like protein